MNYVGIDPSATATGLAYKSNGVWQTVEVSINEWEMIKDFLWFAYSADGKRKIMIEGQFVKKGPFGNAATALLLAMVKGRIVQIAIEIGYEVEQVMPTKWQYALLDIPAKARSEVIKKASIKRAKEVTGENIKSDDIADAINIACYADLLEQSGD